MTFQHYSRDAFFEAIRSHRLANGYPIEPSWKEEIEDLMCRVKAAEWGQEICRRVEGSGERRPVSFAASQSFLNTMASWMAGIAQGKPVFVAEEEAEKRAAICVTCPYNVPSFGASCGACADRLMRGLTRVIGRRQTRYDRSLGSCAICSCSLAAAVWFPLEAQQHGLSEELKEQFRTVSFCWKREGL
jgi:hypothetical protein